MTMQHNEQFKPSKSETDSSQPANQSGIQSFAAEIWMPPKSESSDPNPTSKPESSPPSVATPEPALSQGQVKSEAQKLEDIANQFLSGNDETGALRTWQAELINLTRHGMGSVDQVFQQIKSDNSGINPLLDSVSIRQLPGGAEQIEINPSFADSFLALNYRSIGAIVSPDDVFSGGVTQHNLKHEYLKADNQLNGDGHFYIDISKSPY